MRRAVRSHKARHRPLGRNHRGCPIAIRRLQVFHLARDAHPYDEEFLLAALLHDVGKAIDLQDHVTAGIEALRGTVTERTLWLIEHHMDLLGSRERSLPPRLRRELGCGCSPPPDTLGRRSTS